MPTRKTTKSNAPSRPPRTSRSVKTASRPSNVVRLHDHLMAKGQGSTTRCKRMRLMAELAPRLNPELSAQDQMVHLRFEARTAFPG